MNNCSNRQKRKISLRFMIIAFAVTVFCSAGTTGCDIIKGKPSIITDAEKKFGKEVPQSSQQVEYKTIEESTTLKIIAVDPHADLDTLGAQLANEAKDKSLLEVDVYDDENEAKNYRVRMDPSITKEDAAYEDNEAHLVAIYKKNTNNGENFIEIYKDIGHEDTEIIKF